MTKNIQDTLSRIFLMRHIETKTLESQTANLVKILIFTLNLWLPRERI